MGLFDLSTASEDLEDLLDRERAAIMGGHFDQLDRLAKEKERLVRTIVKDGAPAGELARLKESSDRNGRLLDAMRAGVEAAQARLKAMRTPSAPLQTYDAAGQRQKISAGQRSAVHRV